MQDLPQSSALKIGEIFPNKVPLLWLVLLLLFSIFLVVAGLPGLLALLLLPLLGWLVGNFQIAVFGVIMFLPYIGDRDVASSKLAMLWMVPFAIAAFSWLFHTVWKPSSLFLNPAITPVFGCIIFVAIASMFQGFNLADVPEIVGPYTRVGTYFAAASFFLFGMSAMDSEKKLRRLLIVLIVSGIPYAALLPFFNKEAEAGGRSFGIFTANSGAALHMQICALAALALIRGSSQISTRIILSVTALGYFCTQKFTISKTALASIPVLVVIWMLLEWGWRRTILISLVLATLLSFSFPVLPQKIQKQLATIVISVFSSKETKQLRSGDGKSDISTYQQRLIHYDRARSLIQDRPLLGYGLATSGWISNISVPAGGPWIHSYYYVAAVDTGLLGLGLRLLLLVTVIFTGCKVHRQASLENRIGLQDMTAGLILILVSCLIMFLTIPGSETGERHSWFFSGIIASLPLLLTLPKKFNTKLQKTAVSGERLANDNP